MTEPNKPSLWRRFRDTQSKNPDYWAKSSDPYAREKAARSRTISPSSLAILASDPVARIRALAAANEVLVSKEILIRLATDLDLTCRAGLSQRKNLPLEAAEILAKDEDPYVRQRLAETPSFLPDRLLCLLSVDSDGLVKDYTIHRILNNYINQIERGPQHIPDQTILLNLIEWLQARQAYDQRGPWGFCTDAISKLLELLTIKSNSDLSPDKIVLGRLLSNSDKSIRLLGISLAKKAGGAVAAQKM